MHYPTERVQSRDRILEVATNQNAFKKWGILIGCFKNAAFLFVALFGVRRLEQSLSTWAIELLFFDIYPSDQWRRMLRPQFRDAILFDLIPQMTGLKLDYLRKTVAVRPQYHDGLIYLPFEETIEEGEQKFKKWAVCNLKDE